MKKRILSVFLTLCMVFTLMPALTLTANAANYPVDITGAVDIAAVKDLIDTELAKCGNGDTVTVKGTFTGATDPLTLDISGGVTVEWEATLTSNVSLQRLILLSGAGVFDVTGGKIESAFSGTTGGRAIESSGTTTVNVSGGVVSAAGSNGRAIQSSGTVNVSDGKVSATGSNGSAIENIGTATVNVSGGVVSGVGYTIHNYSTGAVSISDGTVTTTGGTAVWLNDGIVFVSGGTIAPNGIVRGIIGIGYYTGSNADKFGAGFTANTNLFQLDAAPLTVSGAAYTYDNTTPSNTPVVATLSDKLTVTSISATGANGTANTTARTFTFNETVNSTNIKLEVESTITGTSPAITVNFTTAALSVNYAPAATTYTVTYNGNGHTGGTAPVDSNSPYNDGDTVTVLSEGDLIKSGHTFNGWNTAADGSGTDRAAGSTFAISADTTLHAKWTPSGTTYTVTFNANGGTVPETTRTVNAGAVIGTLPTPSRSGSYSFNGWYTAASGGTQITASTIVNDNVTYFAQWTYTGGNGGNNNGGYTPPPTTSASLSPHNADFDKNGGGDITVTLNRGSYTLGKLTHGAYTLINGTDYTVSGNTYTIKTAYLQTLDEGAQIITFDMSGGADPKLTITVKDTTPPKEDKDPDPPVDDWVNPFTDVTESDWFFEAVKYAHQNGLVVGTTPTTFSPQITMTRGMMVMILYNHAGKPQASGAAFTDVRDGAWYADAVNWAAANGIVSGYGNGKFGANDEITREQMAVIFYNYARFIDAELPKKRAGAFIDDAQISRWAKEAVDAMYAAEILNGKGQNDFDPQGISTRAEVVAMMKNFLECIGG